MSHKDEANDWCQPENVDRLIQRAEWMKELMLEDPPAKWKLSKADMSFLKGIGIKG